MSVVEAVQRDLDAIKVVAPALAESALAMTALSLAGELDNSRNSATSKSMCARALVDVLEQIRALAPPQRKTDGVDDLGARRAARRASLRGSGTADQPRS